MPLRNTVHKLRIGYLATVKRKQPKIMPVVQPIVQPVSFPIQPIVQSIPIQFQPILMPAEGRKEEPRTPGIFEIERTGFEIPKFFTSKTRPAVVSEEKEEDRSIVISYPLIPRKPAQNEPVFASAKIFWDSKSNKYLYQLAEPPLPQELKDTIYKIKDLVEQKLDIDFSKLKRFEAKDYLHKTIEDLLTYYSFKITLDQKRAVHYYIERDYIGLGKIEPFLRDSDIEDISCDGVGIPIFIYHRNSKIGSVETNVVFDDGDELDSFVIRLAQLCGKSVSVASPLVDGSLPDGSRLQATLGTDIASRGSNFTIRKFTEEPLTPVDLINYETVDVPMLAFLWMIIDYGKSILISGGTASGKTSMLNVLSLFIRPDKKIISIEDTPELKLPHSHWVPQVARVAMSLEAAKKIGEVDLFDLLKESLRQRPDYIIVGEVRGKEAFVLFQEMATGHPSLATIHAENTPKLMDRLTTSPINLPASLLGSLDIIIFLLRVRYKNRHVRRVNEILEVLGVDENTKTPVFNRIFKWDSVNDKFDIVAKSTLVKKISDMTGLNEHQIQEELERRMHLLSWMQEKSISNYKDVFQVLNLYYNYPERVMASIEGATE